METLSTERLLLRQGTRGVPRRAVCFSQDRRSRILPGPGTRRVPGGAAELCPLEPPRLALPTASARSGLLTWMGGAGPATAVAVPRPVASSLRKFFASLKTRPAMFGVVAVGDER